MLFFGLQAYTLLSRSHLQSLHCIAFIIPGTDKIYHKAAAGAGKQQIFVNSASGDAVHLFIFSRWALIKHMFIYGLCRPPQSWKE